MARTRRVGFPLHEQVYQFDFGRSAALGGTGYFPIPVPLGSKRPVLEGWPELRLTVQELPRYFDGPSNIGVLLSAPYGLADIDLDSPQALRAWSELGVETGLVFGHASAPASHHFYHADPPLGSVKYVDPTDKSSVLELRCLASGGEVGLQTVVPPSVHESGEIIRFDCDGEAANVDAVVLARAAARTAAAALLAKHWPAKGTRNAAFLALAGTFARILWPQADTLALHRAIYFCLWPEAPDFGAAQREVENTYRRLEEGREITGYGRLGELIGVPVLRAVARWLKIEIEWAPRTIGLDATRVLPEINTLNAAPIFSGRLSFTALRKRGPVIVAALADGNEIVWKSSTDLLSFSRTRALIADSCGAYIPIPPTKNKIEHTWEPIAELILRIAGRDSQSSESGLTEEFRELLTMAWIRARKPHADVPEDVAALAACSRQIRNPQAEPPACCVWRVEEDHKPATC
jgi:hypothetical protein